jgi:RNA recognition motif-containing protein
MIVFFSNIPDDTLHSEIKAFIQPVINGSLLGVKGKVARIEVIALKDRISQLIEYHALVIIEPESAAIRIIKKLNGQHFKGRTISVRKYFLRNWRNDKRSDENESVRQHNEKRVNTQRRRNMEFIDKNSPEYSSYESLYRHF